jgi:Sigma-54 interaction domain
MRVLPQLGGKSFLFVTAFGQIEQAVRLTRAGAADYIAKPYALPDLLERIERLIAFQPDITGVLGASEAMRQVEVLLRRVSNIDSCPLLTGESGVGKEVVAHFVHQISTRAKDPFIAVNCAAIPNELIESEPFGHERGAFTGAQSRHHGYVERARNGILFLDEVGELPMAMQAKLLRLMEERVFTRVGGETAITTSARVICATNVDLERAVAEARFRSDLYYRINVISVAIPPLRDGPDDILPLAYKFIAGVCPRDSRVHAGRGAGLAAAFVARQRTGAPKPRRAGGGTLGRQVDRRGHPLSCGDGRAIRSREPMSNPRGDPLPSGASAHPRRAHKCRRSRRGRRQTTWRLALDAVRENAEARHTIRNSAAEPVRIIGLQHLASPTLRTKSRRPSRKAIEIAGTGFWLNMAWQLPLSRSPLEGHRQEETPCTGRENVRDFCCY